MGDPVALESHQTRVEIDRNRVADLGLDISVIGRTLETLLGGRNVTTFQIGAQQYDVTVALPPAERTSPETLAKAYDYVLQIGKTPIVVNDSRGFYTSRVFATYVMEGIAMLGEGVHPRSIEVAGLKAGMPMPPLALQDEVSLSLSLHIGEQTRKDLAAEGKTVPDHPAHAVLMNIGATHGRVGKKSGKGFYDYQGKEKTLWPELTRLYPPQAAQPSQQELIDRLMFIQANEAARCYEEKVVRSVADTNVGAIFGWGFAPHQGGALQFINAMGAERFVARSRELAKRHGTRFEPAAIVVKMAQEGTRFED